MGQILFGVDRLVWTLGTAGHGYIATTFEPGSPYTSQEFNAGPGDHHPIRDFFGSAFRSGPNITIFVDSLGDYNQGYPTILQAMTAPDAVPDDVIRQVTDRANAWAAERFGSTAYEIFGPNSNTVPPATALYVAAELTRLGYGDALQPIDFTIDGLYQPGIETINSTIARLPADLKADARIYAETLPAQERETVLGTLAEIARDIASDIAATAERAWSSISTAASNAFGYVIDAVQSA